MSREMGAEQWAEQRRSKQNMKLLRIGNVIGRTRGEVEMKRHEPTKILKSI